MNLEEYKKLKAQARPIVKRLRTGDKVSAEEKAIVTKASDAKKELWTVKPPICYIGGLDVRRWLPHDFTYDEEYRSSTRKLVRKLVKRRVLMDVEYAKAHNTKALDFGKAYAELKTAKVAEKEAAEKADKAKREAERKAARDVKAKEKAIKSAAFAERKAEAKKKLIEKAKAAGIKVVS